MARVFSSRWSVDSGVSVVVPTEKGKSVQVELTRLRGHLDTWDQESHKEAHYAAEVHPRVPARVPC